MEKDEFISVKVWDGDLSYSLAITKKSIEEGYVDWDHWMTKACDQLRKSKAALNGL